MSKQYKYISNNGLAFDEHKSMKKLAELAKEGWILQELKVFRYKLVKAEPRELKYCLDYRAIEEDDRDYFDMFAAAGWEHICSYGDMHIFAAHPDTVEIYTDRESHKQKYRPSRKNTSLLAFIFLAAFLLAGILRDGIVIPIDSAVVMWVLSIVYYVSLVLFFPSAAMLVAYIWRERKAG
ncbi:MAG: DUF2812 domain-containing protein [Bacillus sp. (in: firmicutes)]